ncbi:MAG: YfhO family protein [Ignavibacteriae bacterium]|nr:YfhO family protein [Ignavibacteriota bacterium]
MNSPESIVLFMNTNEFKPDSIALILNTEKLENANFNGKGEIKTVEQNPNFIELESNTDTEQFMVLSEIYYPKGWKALVDGNETEIYQTNHILRGIQVPAGKHKITFEFRPQTYFTSLTFLWIGNILILGLILVPAFFYYKKNSK